MICIKDFEMPKTCADCPIYYDFMHCGITGTEYTTCLVEYNFDDLKARMNDCPLVEVECDGTVAGDEDE